MPLSTKPPSKAPIKESSEVSVVVVGFPKCPICGIASEHIEGESEHYPGMFKFRCDVCHDRFHVKGEVKFCPTKQ